MGFADQLRKLDSHSSVSSEFRVYTASGAILSVITLTTILYLVVTEVYFNFQVTLAEKVHVNATSPTGLEMEFDVTFHSVSCKQLEIDASDPTGQSQSLHLDQKHHIWKHRVIYDDKTKLMKYLGDRTKLEMGSTLLNEEDLIAMANPEMKSARSLELRDAVVCGSCYGAGAEGECCNTCEDVMRAYKTKGWVFPDNPTEISQCHAETEDDTADGEGCNVHGMVALSTGGGNLHLAPGRDLSMSMSKTVNLFDLIMQSYTEWNVTHTIHKLRFGAEYPDATYQLDGEVRTITDGHGMYQYYFQVVPTLYRYLNGTIIQTNQYSVTEHLRHVNPGSNRGLPGVFFFYELSPLHVEYSEVYRKGYIAFFTSVCAIVGGVVTIMGLIDSVLFQTGHKTAGLAR